MKPRCPFSPGGHEADHPSYVAHHFDSAEHQFAAGKLGMWVFILTEIMFFSGLFCAHGLPVDASGRSLCTPTSSWTRISGRSTLGADLQQPTMAWAVRCAVTSAAGWWHAWQSRWSARASSWESSSSNTITSGNIICFGARNSSPTKKNWLGWPQTQRLSEAGQAPSVLHEADAQHTSSGSQSPFPKPGPAPPSSPHPATLAFSSRSTSS